MANIFKFFNKNKIRGFTLIELVVVIAVLGALAMFATPNFMESSRGVKGQEIQNNISMIDYKVGMYTTTNETSSIPGLMEIDPNEIKAAYNEDRLFDANGYANIKFLEGFYDLTGTDITNGITGSIDGIYAINEGKVFFIASETINVAIEKSVDIEPPIITINPYSNVPTNQDVTICASTNEGYFEQNCYTFTDNGTFEFVATDIAGNETTQVVTVDFIDKTPPVITIAAYTTTPTNQNILVEATVNEGTLNSASHTFTNNGTFTFIAVDTFGNESQKIITITNIDKTPPIIPTLISEVSGGTGTVTITYSGDSVGKQFKVGAGIWENYIGPITITSNNIVYAKGTDNAGNISAEGSVSVVLDSTPPVVAFAVNGNSTPAKSHGTIVSVTDDGSGVNPTSLQYAWSTSSTPPGAGWAAFTNGSTVSHSGVTGNYYLHIKASDIIGNAGTVTSNAFNFDNAPPTTPTLVASITTPTNGNVSVTITYSADSTVKQYKINTGGTWTNYTAAVSITANGTVYSRGQDSAGNWSTEGNIVISNIDKTPPTTPTLVASITTPTNGNVLVTATYSADSTVKQYKIGSAGIWTNYTAAVAVTANNTVYARGQDAAGNLSTEGSLVISNIDKTPPTTPTLAASITTPTNQNVSVTITYSADSTVKQYKINAGGTWTNYTAAISMSANGTVYARGQDVAGNLSAEGSIIISNIDKVPPTAPTVLVDPHINGAMMTLTYPGDAATKQFSYDNVSWWNWPEITLSTKIPIGSIIYGKSIDAAGNISTLATGVPTEELVVKLSEGNLASTYFAITQSGNVYGWGWNQYKTLGDGTSINRFSPVRILMGQSIKKVSTSMHTIALSTTGKVFVWGTNDTGQMGNGTLTDQLTPLELTFFNGKGVIDVGVSGFSSYAVTSTGDVYSWGYNGDGELGLGDITERLVPTKSTGASGKGITSIYPGERSVYAITPTAVYSWGANYSGQLGHGNLTSLSTPKAITGLASKGVTYLSSGERHVYARTSGGRIYAWGNGGDYKIGDGTQTQRTTPLLLAQTGVSKVVAGWHFGMALTTTPTVLSWGYDARGQLGHGTDGVTKTTPTTISTLTGKSIKDISAGYYSAVVLATNGDMYSWSDNGDGSLAHPSSTLELWTPTLITSY